MARNSVTRPPRQEPARNDGQRPLNPEANDADAQVWSETDTDAQNENQNDDDRLVVDTVPVPLAKSRINWGPVWAGVLATLAIFTMLEFLCYAAGWTTFQDTGNGLYYIGVPWVTGLVFLIALFCGGWLAAATQTVKGAEVGTMDGMLAGFMVWALGVSLVFAAGIFGLGNAFGLLGTGVSAISAAGQPGLLNPANGAAAGTIRGLSWGIFVELIVTLVITVAGGWMGGRSEMFQRVERIFVPRPHVEEKRIIRTERPAD